MALDVAFSDGFVWYISEHVPAQGRADYSVVDHLRWFDYDAHRCRMMMAMLPSVSAWTLRKRAMLSLQR